MTPSSSEKIKKGIVMRNLTPREVKRMLKRRSEYSHIRIFHDEVGDIILLMDELEVYRRYMRMRRMLKRWKKCMKL